jgi:two-component system, cell cycle response regulator DivK
MDGQKVVIMVDDNLDNLEAAHLGLELLGVPFRGFESGAAFFQQMAESPHHVSLILLDLQMPYQDGYTVLEQIRRHPVLGQTRVVALTANVLADEVARCRQAGFDGFLGKPLDPRQFPAQIKQILSGQSLWRPR